MTARDASHDLRDLREHFGYFCSQTTRWNDNDPYGHVNNAIYYEYFDSAANRYLIEQGGLDIEQADTIGVVVESMCRYRMPVSYPSVLDVGLRVNRLGQRSVEYGIAIFESGAPRAAAVGYFSHVFVGRSNLRPVSIPPLIRQALMRL